MPNDEVLGPFRDHGFLVQPVSGADFADVATFAGMAAVVFVQSATKPNQIAAALRNHAQPLLDHGCLAIVVMVTAHVNEDGSRMSYSGLVAQVIGQTKLPMAGASTFTPEELASADLVSTDDQPLPHVRLFGIDTPWRYVANALALVDHDTVISAKLAIHAPRHVKLSNIQELMLRRAFADCSSIHLVAMDDEGKSGASVFRAYADLQSGLLGPWPQPYFVKIGPRDKIFQEFQNYAAVVSPYVPFHLGPRLIAERCHLGANHGVIVGDFVERSESLRDCASRGRAGPAIASLFQSTLHGWYRLAVDDPIPLPKRLHFPKKKPPAMRLHFAKRLGLTRSLSALRQLYLQSMSLTPVLTGPIHGDLHAANILVRGGDAILIDFYAHKDDMPILFDIACLEVSLLIDGFENDDRETYSWLRSILPLYEAPLLRSTCATTHPKEPSAWFFACVNQLRLFARDMQRCDGQYAAVLAIALLRKACKDPKLTGKANRRRAAAYVLAEKLLHGTFAASAVNDVTAPARSVDVA
jgi:hypothetical protein